MPRLSEDRCLCRDHVINGDNGSREMTFKRCPIHSATYVSARGSWLNRLIGRKAKRS